MKYLIKLGSEITIKSDGVRKMCIKRLRRNIASHLDYELIDSRLSWTWDRVILDVDDIEDQEKIIEILKCISGVWSFCQVIEYKIGEDILHDTQKIFSFVSEKTLSYFLPIIENKSFVVRLHRSGKHNFKSTDFERELWWDLLEGSENARVNLHNPDIRVQLDIKDDKLYILKEKIDGLSWYPIGFQDRVVSLISGWFDSGVSTFSLMNRGCNVDYLFFNLWGTAHELWVKHVSQYLWKTFSVSYKKARFISVPFEWVIKELLEKVDHKYRGVILKRLMLKVASRIAYNNYYALIKGDSIGQVSSQTLKNMYVIDKAADILVIRPLVWMNKQDIVDVSKKIGTHDFAASMPEYCGVISDKPSTWADYEDILEAEKALSEDIINSAFENRTLERVSQMLFEKSSEEIREVQELWSEDIIVDIREPIRVKKSPLSQKWIQNAQEIPFYEINYKFPKLDQSKQYLFYCDKWVLSHLHGLYLKEKWFSNIKVFRP